MGCKFSCQARQYILAYFYIEHKMKEEIEDGLHEINIEKIKKEFKTHCSAICFDEKFINHCFQKSDLMNIVHYSHPQIHYLLAPYY
jgi:hypothetical protein